MFCWQKINGTKNNDPSEIAYISIKFHMVTTPTSNLCTKKHRHRNVIASHCA